MASFGLLVVGGGLWWWDVRGLSDLRGKVRRGMGVSDEEGDRGGGNADEELEEWVAAVLKRREEKVRRGGGGGIRRGIGMFEAWEGGLGILGRVVFDGQRDMAESKQRTEMVGGEL